MWIGIITLFPGMFHAITHYGITGRAVQRGAITLHYWNPRDFSIDRHRRIDDRPYGGGPGMVMQAAPLYAAIQSARSTAGTAVKVIYLSPQGRLLNQQAVMQLATQKYLILVCGRYEGVDERLIQESIDEEWSVGNYVVSGGELPAMTLVDALARCLPGVLGTALSAQNDSFVEGLLDHPHYTRPAVFSGSMVPSVLLSGNHEAIRRWRLQQSLGRTWLRKPELLQHLNLTKEQAQLLAQFQQAYFAKQSHRTHPEILKKDTL